MTNKPGKLLRTALALALLLAATISSAAPPIPASSVAGGPRAGASINLGDIYNNIGGAQNTANYAVSVGGGAQNTANYAVSVASNAQGSADYANARVDQLSSGGIRGSWATVPNQPVGLSNGCTTEMVYCPAVWGPGQPVPGYTLWGGCIWGFPQSPIYDARTVYFIKYPTSGNFNIPPQQPPSVNCPAGSGFVTLSQVTEPAVGPPDQP